LPVLLLGVYLVDVGRVNSKFMFLVDIPKESRKEYNTPVIDYLARQPKVYRMLPLNGGPGPYSSKNVPVMFIPMPVQQRRWQEYLDNFNYASAMPDILNVKYLVMGSDQYAKVQNQFAPKYTPIFIAPDNSEVVLENHNVMPKAWLVPSVRQFSGPADVLVSLQNPSFDPWRLALVESPPTLPMQSPESAAVLPQEGVKLQIYEGEHILVNAVTSQNALLVLGEKYYHGWKATVDEKPVPIERVNYLLRGVYLSPGDHNVELKFDPLPFKIGKYLTLTSFALFAGMLVREWLIRRKRLVIGG
jgi:hypothetical protein